MGISGDKLVCNAKKQRCPGIDRRLALSFFVHKR